MRFSLFKKNKRAKIEEEKSVALDKLLTRMAYYSSLYKITVYTSEEFNSWIRKRLEITLAMFMYRNGYTKTAEAIVAESKLEVSYIWGGSFFF